jgi:Multiubiquitin
MQHNTIKKLRLEIEGKNYSWDEQFITGKQLKSLADIGEGQELFLSLPDSWDDELISNDATVDLAREGIEYFYVKRPLHFNVDGRQFAWEKQYITGKQIRKAANVGEEFDIYLDNKGQYEDVLVEDVEKVNLSRPGTEHFKTMRADVEVTIVVNGRPKQWLKAKITYDQVVELAGGNAADPNVIFTVTYDKGPRQNPEGSMVKGDKVRVKNKMVFNATPTNRS